jgi:hypothetical protein
VAKTPLRKAGNNDFDSTLRESQVWRACDFPHEPFEKFCVPLSVALEGKQSRPD